MVKKIIESELREQAGSNSYNRFEYQVHCIVHHMIEEYVKKKQFFIFCEFHDDMANIDLSSSPNCAEFFQIKTTNFYY
ncbi:dsDNA nuclease domain-containing protein [Peribacillus butanolivorans]|uniref:dsDNA nuclease domain-containing protein n=1 Tax=Peribacillus butanolivorans TaxID=421767 RepID=UPI0035DFA9CD